MLCGPLRAWELAALFLGAKMLHDVMAGEGSCKVEKLHTQSRSELHPWFGMDSLGEPGALFGEPHSAQHLFITLCASCLSDLINFGQPQKQFGREDIHKVSRQLGWGASSPSPLWTGACWWVLL